VKTFAQNGALLRNFLAAARKELRPFGTNHTNSAHPEKCLFMNRIREKISPLPHKNAEKRTRQEDHRSEDHRSVERFLGSSLRTLVFVGGDRFSYDVVVHRFGLLRLG
jgi:hypothetical protein